MKVRLQFVNGMRFIRHPSYRGGSRIDLGLTIWKFLIATKMLLFGR